VSPPQNEKEEERILHKGQKMEGVTLSSQRAEEWWVFDWLLSRKRSRISGKERRESRRETRMTTRR